MTDVEERVARGAVWLDEHERGWERRVDLAVLNMADGSNRRGGCIVCQVTGSSFWGAVEAWVGTEIYRSWSADHGFNLWTHCGVYHMPDDTWESLDAAWRALIKARFDSGLLSDLR